MRGVSGAGKSTWVKGLEETSDENVLVCSADDYWLDKNGEYKFVPSQLGEAHKECFRKFTQLIHYANTDSVIVVDNTNTQLHEIAPYLKFAELYYAEVSIVRIKCDAVVAHDRNVHGVPANTVSAQANKMEKLPKYWPKETVVFTSGIGETD